MKLSEAISLGHTLIGEDRYAYYDDDSNCGCALGSAAAATGSLQTYWRSGTMLDWTQKRWPWTKAPVGTFPQLLAITHPKTGHRYYAADDNNVAEMISGLHCCGFLNRLEIAALIAQIEPDEEPTAEPTKEVPCATSSK